MKLIGDSIPKGSALQVSRQGFDVQQRRGPLPSSMPAVIDREADVEIPRAWSSWRPANGPRHLRRALTAEERAALEKRRDELAPWVAGYEGDRERDQVALAVADMFGAYRSARHVNEDAVGLIDSVCRLLRDFPVWAIVKACNSIQQFGVWRNGAFDRQWPPSDPEIMSEVREKLRLYGDQYRSAVDLLNAEVEQD